VYLDNQATPNDIQLKVYTDKEWDKIFDCESINPWEIPLPKYDVWRCPNCERIYVFKEGIEEAIKVYQRFFLPREARHSIPRQL
jgi:hypothetical protein